jgi:DNA-binding transcriptional ArsR family regulator
MKQESKHDLKTLEKQMKALANARRLAILRYLKKSKEATVGDIAEEIKLSFKSTSKHLAILYAAGVLEKDQRNIAVFYRLTVAPHTIAKHILSML